MGAAVRTMHNMPHRMEMGFFMIHPFQIIVLQFSVAPDMAGYRIRSARAADSMMVLPPLATAAFR
jgi:hypothetical protein